jgi:hypothetical protein
MSMTVREIAKSLSPVARTALENTRGHRIGTVVPGASVELLDRGVTGPGAGLTVRGSAVAEIVQDEALDRAFG